MTPDRRTFVIVALALVGGLLLLLVGRYLVPTSDLEIIAAEYGVPGRTCTAGAEIKQHASMACGGYRPRCLISVSSGWCGDPVPGVMKTLTIDYKCGDKSKRASAVDGTGLELSCP